MAEVVFLVKRALMVQCHLVIAISRLAVRLRMQGGRMQMGVLTAHAYGIAFLAGYIALNCTAPPFDCIEADCAENPPAQQS